MNIEIDIYVSSNLVEYEEQIGNGSVFKASMDGRIVAIKRFDKKDMIKKESQKLAKLWNRGGITSFLGLIEEESRISMVMEYVEGGTLLDYIKEKGHLIGWEGKRIILNKIANALSMCHEEAGIIHSNIKAENILMDHNLNPKIANFGAVNEAPTYESDIYSFGMMCYEVLNDGKTVRYI